jgi:hypothetical protein
MGYVKLKKAGTAFDILSAENVGSIKLAGSGSPEPIIVTYITAGSSAAKQLEVTIVPNTNNFVQADVDALNEAVGTAGGGAGMVPVSLAQTVASVTVSEN